MSDIFISYARSTEPEARRIAEALRALGYGVWRDDELPAHRSYTDVIEERLKAAKAVVVVWSAEAVKSEWVQSEADRARVDRKLVQLTVDGAPLPMPFDRIQCADLTGWSGDAAALGWRKVTDSVTALVNNGGERPGASPVAAIVASAPAERRLAVLAFDNLSPDPEMSFFSDGVSEEILETVSRNTGLQVIARASSFQFRGPAKAARHVAAELNVSHLLDGSVRRSGSKVRVSAQLVECASEARIWSERFDRDLDDVFALQDEIAAAVASALETAFARAGPAPSKVDPTAYDLLLRARDFTTFRSLEERLDMMERSVALAPDFAVGWAWLALMRVNKVIVNHGHQPVAPLVDAARSAAMAAEQLDPTLGFARAVRSRLEPYAAYARREALLTEALRLNPSDANCLTHMSFLAGEVGRCGEALDLARRAMLLDPQSVPSVARWLIMLDDRYEEQAAGYDEARGKWPENAEFSVTAAAYAAGKGDWSRYEMLKQHALAQPFAKDSRTARMMRETYEFWEAIRDDDRALLDRYVADLIGRVSARATAPLEWIWSLAAVGYVDVVYDAVERASFDAAFELGGAPISSWWPGSTFLRYLNRPLMEDPRFLRLCGKLGLVAYWLDTDRWPDCAETAPYDFRAEARKVAAEGMARRV